MRVVRLWYSKRLDGQTYVHTHTSTHKNTYSVWKQRSANVASYPDMKPLPPDMVSAHFKVKQSNVESGPMNERKR